MVTQKESACSSWAAGGRDFHNFNCVYKDDQTREVVAFTAAQIPGISGRVYPSGLAGRSYPRGIPIVDESELEALIANESIDEVTFAYSDVTHEAVMHAAARAQSAGADFVLLGPRQTMLRSEVPVLAVCALRTGCGKSQTARWICQRLAERGFKAAVLRHPMPYGDLQAQAVQRFASRADLDAANCTAEEREEYEPYVDIGHVIYAGVDYERILAEAQSDADLVIWDGGNNDFPFLAADLLIVIGDALRPNQVVTHYPGELVARMADVFLVNKVDAASAVDVQHLCDSLAALNPAAPIFRAKSPVALDDPDKVRGRRVLIVEDGPTITHGGMAYGAGFVAMQQVEHAGIVDPRDSAPGIIEQTYQQYPHIGRLLPAIGYNDQQLQGLAQTIEASSAEVVVSATPCDLGALIDVSKPIVRVRYWFNAIGEPDFGQMIDSFASEHLGERRKS